MPSEQIPLHVAPAYYLEILEQVRKRAGLESAEEAQDVLDATLDAMGSCMPGLEALKLSDQMPADLANTLGTSDFAGACEGEDDLYRRVERQEGVGPGFAREHVQAVCRVLSEVLLPEVCQRLASVLPPSLTPLLVPAPAAETEEAPHASQTAHAPAGTGHTLADGRPGSRHPLSEGHPERGQPDSVAGTGDPYEDRKLSTSHPQAREGHTLAEGKPGSDHPVSDSD